MLRLPRGKPVSVSRKVQRLSVDEYLEAEKDSPVRDEYIDGQIYAMAGARDRHNISPGICTIGSTIISVMGPARHSYRI